MIHRCAASDRMSRSEIVLLPCVLPTASQVMTMDPKSTIAEAKIFNFLAADGFPGSCGALLPTAWHRCKCRISSDYGWYLSYGTLKLDTPTRS